MTATASGTDVQVLTFQLGDERYCVDIEYIAEIVDGDQMTAIPNSEDYVEGIMDLRGRTTTIVNPCTILETDGVDPSEIAADGGRTQNRVVILDPDTVETDGATGWLVSDVKEVLHVSEGVLETDAVSDNEALEGVIKNDDGFILWVNPNELVAN